MSLFEPVNVAPVLSLEMTAREFQPRSSHFVCAPVTVFADTVVVCQQSRGVGDHTCTHTGLFGAVLVQFGPFAGNAAESQIWNSIFKTMHIRLIRTCQLYCRNDEYRQYQFLHADGTQVSEEA